MIRVKICGITRVDDALAAANAGADAIGLVFVGKSSRNVTMEQAAAICHALPPLVSRVGLFMDAGAGQIRTVLKQVPLNWLQFHGTETQSFCRQFQRPWIKALAMRDGQPPDINSFDQADALLLDAHAGSSLGGSGEVFDWSQIPAMPRPWLLAGGLRPDNVAAACRQARPDAVDVSSGVEARPGIKDANLVNQFIKAVKHG